MTFCTFPIIPTTVHVHIRTWPRSGKSHLARKLLADEGRLFNNVCYVTYSSNVARMHVEDSRALGIQACSVLGDEGPFDYIVLDDIFMNPHEQESEAFYLEIYNWLRSLLMARRAPSAQVVSLCSGEMQGRMVASVLKDEPVLHYNLISSHQYMKGSMSSKMYTCLYEGGVEL